MGKGSIYSAADGLRKKEYDDDGSIGHNGTEYGYLYVIDEPVEIDADIYQYLRSCMDRNAEFLTKRDLKVRWIKDLPV